MARPQNHIDNIIRSSPGVGQPQAKGKRFKTHCTKFLQEGVCGFMQNENGCKFSHEMPTTREGREAAGLYNGIPQWYKNWKAEKDRAANAALSDKEKEKEKEKDETVAVPELPFRNRATGPSGRGNGAAEPWGNNQDEQAGSAGRQAAFGNDTAETREQDDVRRGGGAAGPTASRQPQGRETARPFSVFTENRPSKS